MPPSLVDAAPGGRLLTLARHNLLLVLRDPVPMLTYVVIPIVLMSGLAPMYTAALGDGSRGAAQAGAGQSVMFSLFALGVVANQIFRERERRTLDRLRMTPVRGIEIVVAKLAPLYVVLLVQQVLLLGYAAVLLGLDLGPSPLLVVGAVTGWSVCVLVAAAALGLSVSSNGQLSATKDIGAISLSVLGGALLPISQLPGWMQATAPFSPAYWAIAAYRAALAGDVAETGRSLAVLAGMSALAAAYVVRRLRGSDLRVRA